MENNDPPIAPIPRRVSRSYTGRIPPAALTQSHFVQPSDEQYAATGSGAVDLAHHRRPGSTGSEPMSIGSSPPRSSSSAPSKSFLIRAGPRKSKENLEVVRVHTAMSCSELVMEVLRALLLDWTETDRERLYPEMKLGIWWARAARFTVIKPSNVQNVLEFWEQRRGRDVLYCLVWPHPEREEADREGDTSTLDQLVSKKASGLSGV